MKSYLKPLGWLSGFYHSYQFYIKWWLYIVGASLSIWVSILVAGDTGAVIASIVIFVQVILWAIKNNKL